MYNRDEIGKRIKSARQEKHLSQMQFAELINVSTPYLSDIENGKTNLSIKRTLPPPAKPQSSRPQNRSYGSAPRSSAPNDRSSAPRQTASAPAQPQQKSFDDMLKQFMTESSSKMSSIKQYSEHKTKTRRR